MRNAALAPMTESGKPTNVKISFTRRLTTPQWRVPTSCWQNRLPQSDVRDQFYEACHLPGEDTYLQVLARLFDEAGGYATLAYIHALEGGATMSILRWQKWMSRLRKKRMLVKRNGSP